MEPGPRGAERRLYDLLVNRRPDVDWHYGVGQALAEVRGSGPGGTESVRGLARRVGLSRAQVQQHLHLVAAYRRDDLAGLPRVWSAVLALLAVPDAATRARLQQAAVAGGWSILRLRREARAARAGRSPPNDPIRHVRVQADLGELLHLADLAADWLKRWEAWAERLPAGQRHQLLREYARRPAASEPTGRSGSERLHEAGVHLHRLKRAVAALVREIEDATWRIDLPPEPRPAGESGSPLPPDGV
jgi:hypothetical protein